MSEPGVPVQLPGVLRCDECHPRPSRAVWEVRGVDPRGRSYRAVTCEGHVLLLHDLVDERGGVASLTPLR